MAGVWKMNRCEGGRLGRESELVSLLRFTNCRGQLPCLTWLVLVVLVAHPRRLAAHADLLLQIEEVTKAIEKEPTNADLYLRRGQLWREHVEYQRAYEDIEKAFALMPGLSQIDLMRGRLFLDWGWPLTARAVLDRYLSHQPRNVEGLIHRGRALARLELRRSAADDYDLALKLTTEPSPDLYVERAQVLMALDREDWARAVRGLDEGLQRLGPLVTLQLFAIDAELKLSNYDGALSRVDKIAARSPRKETWYARRGEILVQAGRGEEALKAYESAKISLQTLPPTRRNVPAMRELARRIEAQIDALSAATGKPPGSAVAAPQTP